MSVIPDVGREVRARFSGGRNIFQPPRRLLLLPGAWLRLSEMDGSDDRGGTSDSDSNSNRSHSAASSRKRFGVSRIVPEEGKKRVNYSKGDARRIMEEAVSLCEVMTLGYEVVFHGRRRSYAAHSRPSIMGDGIRCEANFLGLWTRNENMSLENMSQREICSKKVV